MVGLVFPGIAPSYYQDVKDYLKYNHYARKRYDQASCFLGYPILEAFKEAKEEDSVILESAFFINTIALLDMYYEKYQYKPNITTGPSFGGMAAAVQVGSLTFEETLWLTQETSKISKKYFEQLGKYQTLLIYNLLLEDVENIINNYKERGILFEIVGYMGKIICVCGKNNDIKELKGYLNHKRKCFAVDTLNYPMHSELLEPLKVELEKKIYSQLDFKDLENPVISDVDGNLLIEKGDFKQMLLDGINNPVRWDLVVKTMKRVELNDIYVIGPKNIFAQLLKKQFNVINVSPDNSIDSNRKEQA